MKKKNFDPPEKGSTPDEIYRAVGSALSYWEGAEDVLMGIFRWLCADTEPTAFEVYIGSPRNRRMELLKAALVRYGHLLSDDEQKAIRGSIKGLNELASARNEIAHGHCSEFNQTVNGKVMMSGAYLLPSLNEGHWQERSPRYAHTAETIIDFREAVREHRWAAFEAHGSAMMRFQQGRAEAGPHLDMLKSVVRAASEGRIPASEIRTAVRSILAMEDLAVAAGENPE